MSQKSIVIITATFREGMQKSEEFSEYSKKSNVNGEKHGGIVLNKIMVTQNLGVGEAPHFVLVIEYPSRERATTTFTNESYKQLLGLREAVFKDVKILL